MISRGSKDNLLYLIEPHNLITYLKGMGWVEDFSQINFIVKFRSPKPIRSDGTYIYLFVPNDNTLIDYTKAIENILEVISAFERRDYNDILNQIINFADCLKANIINTEKGTIPLNEGVSLYESLRDLITFSACSEYQPRTKRFDRKLSSAIDLVEASLIGQNETESYAVNIYLPLNKHMMDYSLDQVIPLSRRVVIRVLLGLEDLENSAIDDNPKPIIENYNRGLNSNMCEALIKIIDAGMGNNIVLNVIPEPRFYIPDNISTKFILSPTHKKYLKGAMELLKDSTPMKKHEEIEGYLNSRSLQKEINKQHNYMINIY